MLDTHSFRRTKLTEFHESKIIVQFFFLFLEFDKQPDKNNIVKMLKEGSETRMFQIDYIIIILLQNYHVKSVHLLAAAI